MALTCKKLKNKFHIKIIDKLRYTGMYLENIKHFGIIITREAMIFQILGGPKEIISVFACDLQDIVKALLPAISRGC